MRKWRQGLQNAAFAAGLPEDALLSAPRVTLIGVGSALVEGQQGVVELSSSRIRLRTELGVLSVCGGALCLQALSPDMALITGNPLCTVTYDRISHDRMDGV